MIIAPTTNPASSNNNEVLSNVDLKAFKDDLEKQLKEFSEEVLVFQKNQNKELNNFTSLTNE